MRLSGFLMAVGFLTLSAAVLAPTPTSTNVNIPTFATLAAVEAAMPEPTLMPRKPDLKRTCQLLREEKYIEFSDPGPGKTSTLPIKWPPGRLMPRMSPEEIEYICHDIETGNTMAIKIPKYHKEPIYIDENQIPRRG